MLTQILAALGLAICVALAVHMALPPRQRARVNVGLERLLGHLRLRLENARRWRQRRLRERAANDEAADLIRRARQSSRDASSGHAPEGEWDGNVYRPKAFDKPKRAPNDSPPSKPGKLH